MSKDSLNSVDTRFLKNGKIRLRFKLNEDVLNIIHKAIKHTGQKYDHAALDIIALNFLSWGVPPQKLKKDTKGSKRFLVNLYSDQYEIIKEALVTAGLYYNSDADSLAFMCGFYLKCDENSSYTTFKKILQK